MSYRQIEQLFTNKEFTGELHAAALDRLAAGEPPQADILDFECFYLELEQHEFFADADAEGDCLVKTRYYQSHHVNLGKPKKISRKKTDLPVRPDGLPAGSAEAIEAMAAAYELSLDLYDCDSEVEHDNGLDEDKDAAEWLKQQDDEVFDYETVPTFDGL